MAERNRTCVWYMLFKNPSRFQPDYSIFHKTYRHMCLHKMCCVLWHLLLVCICNCKRAKCNHQITYIYIHTYTHNGDARLFVLFLMKLKRNFKPWQTKTTTATVPHSSQNISVSLVRGKLCSDRKVRNNS